MLQIHSISKKYKTGDLVQTALDNVSLNLRDNEFVAILGPSGSGKTTLLNIIGGLDRYDSGDLIINNVSTKNYKDRDWDTYRNHTIGFVFQSYNLIPHQTVLANVELALTIGGISRSQRRKRALEALDKVGLKDQAHKKPNQMSGGQMQRVAIARALVNNPDIVLADEPTGALDTKTSVQVMDLLKQVAKDRLVVMVTHNPELANEYANRIIRLQDGVIISDSNPYNVENNQLLKKAPRVKKAHMSIFTALALSFNNLLTKKGRTILTAFAGSIGIIGIALILSLSQGFQNYIDKIQEDTLSSYPLTITSDTADMTSAILSMVSDRQENQAESENVIERQYLTTMFSSIGTNDLKSFKQYLDYNEPEYSKDVSQIKYSYSVSPNIYTIDTANDLVKLYPSSLWGMLYSNGASSFMSSFSSANGGMIFAEMTDDLDSIKDQYDVLKGRWPDRYDEMIIVLSEPNSISDLLVYSLGLRDNAELKKIISSLMSQDELDINNEPKTFTYDDLLNLDLRLIKTTDTYKYNEKYSIYEDMSDDDEYMRETYDKSLKLKIVGVVCAKDSDSTTALAPGVNFRSDLTQYVIDEAEKTEIVQKQIRNRSRDVFSGKSFDEANEDNKKESQLDFEDMISVDEDMIKEAFKVNISEDDFKFDTLSDAEMSNLIMASSNSVYAQITDPTNLITTTNMITQLCKSSALAAISMYETNAVMEDPLSPGDKILVTDGIPAVRNSITSASIKNNLPSQYSSIFSDTDCNNLATAIKEMIDEYYDDIVNAEIERSSVMHYVKYDVNTVNGEITYSGASAFSTTSSAQVDKIDTYATTSPEMALVITNVVKQIAVGKTALEIGTVIGKIMEPLTDSLSGLGDLFGEDMMKIDTDKFAQAFKFDMSEDELSRLMETMMSGTEEKSYKSNLISLGYQDVNDPTSVSFYFKDFESKENFLAFLDKYNEEVDDEDKEIRYTDITGILMSSVKTIVDSVTYVLIAFVSISLIVSSIMIAVITLISVMERTKEIGILRAMGASKHNVSSIFNAETFIIGLLSGLLGVGVTLASIPPINNLIHTLTDNYDINAVLPSKYAIILVLISVFLTIIAGIIPSRKASKQDPVVALRTE